MHLWTSADAGKRDMLGRLTPATVWSGKGSFHRLMRRALRKALEAGALCPFVAEGVRTEVQREDAAAAAAAAAATAAGGAGSGAASADAAEGAAPPVNTKR